MNDRIYDPTWKYLLGENGKLKRFTTREREEVQ